MKYELWFCLGAEQVSHFLQDYFSDTRKILLSSKNEAALNEHEWINHMRSSNDNINKTKHNKPVRIFHETCCTPVVAEMVHYNDVIMSAMASQITSLTIVYSTVYIQAHIKENIKAPRHWPLCVEFTGDRWIPRTKGQ